MEERAASRRIIRWIATILSFTVLASGLGIIGGAGASADPLPGTPWQAPKAGLSYALDKRAGQWKDAWFNREENEEPWAKESYDPKYVHPTTFGSTFETQCVTILDWGNDVTKNVNTEHTYRWTIDGVVSNKRTCAETRITFNGQGIHDVKLQVIRPDNTILTTKERTVLVKDKLVVLLGDSAASGEGSPEKNRTGDQEFGTWVDRRCHRSSQAAIPRAVMQMEDADPHTTITFLNFACSGATIERFIPEEGVGVLGPYVGIEYPDCCGIDPKKPSTWLPSQVDQLDAALSRAGRYQPNGPDPLREVDKLFISGGINDLRFSKLAMACLLETGCHNKAVPVYNETASVANTLKGYADAIPASFGKVDQALLARDIVTDERYAMQYPDAFSKNAATGALCPEMLEDVIPQSAAIFLTTVLAVILVVLHIIAPPVALAIEAVIHIANLAIFAATGIELYPTLAIAVTGQLKWASDEITWMSMTAMPALDEAVRAGAVLGHFTFIDGIAERFAGHGYCAANNQNWIVRAQQASYRQGPWDTVSQPTGIYYDFDDDEWHVGGLNLHMRTKGLMHPTPQGYEAAKQEIVATNVKRDGRTEPLFEDFKNHAPVAVNNAYSLDVNEDLSLDTGFFGLGVLGNDKDVDFDELRSIKVAGPSHGTATLAQNGRLIYTPTPGYVGTDTITYKATDGGLTGNTATITINVTQPPVPSGFAWTFPTNPMPSEIVDSQALDFPLCRNCADLVVQLADPQPQYGAVTVKPRAGFPGQMALSYNAHTNQSHEIVDAFDVVAGQMVGGVFQELHRATVSVRVEAYLH